MLCTSARFSAALSRRALAFPSSFSASSVLPHRSSSSIVRTLSFLSPSFSVALSAPRSRVASSASCYPSTARWSVARIIVSAPHKSFSSGVSVEIKKPNVPAEGKEPDVPPPTNAAAGADTVVEKPTEFLNSSLGRLYARWTAPRPMPPRFSAGWWFEYSIIFIVFGVTGIATLFIKTVCDDLCEEPGTFKDGPNTYRAYTLVMFLPIYYVLLVFFGGLIGRQHYFVHLTDRSIAKILDRIGSSPKLPPTSPRFEDFVPPPR